MDVFKKVIIDTFYRFLTFNVIASVVIGLVCGIIYLLTLTGMDTDLCIGLGLIEVCIFVICIFYAMAKHCPDDEEKESK